MADILRDDLVQKLQRFAEQEQRPVNEVFEEMLVKFALIEDDTEIEGEPPLGTLARLAYEAQKANFRSGITDTSQKSREILETEFLD